MNGISIICNVEGFTLFREMQVFLSCPQLNTLFHPHAVTQAWCLHGG